MPDDRNPPREPYRRTLARFGVDLSEVAFGRAVKNQLFTLRTRTSGGSGERLAIRPGATSTTVRIVDGSVAALRPHGLPAMPPYGITADGTEWEWCRVLSFETLAGSLPESVWLFEPTPTVQALALVERRSLAP